MTFRRCIDPIVGTHARYNRYECLVDLDTEDEIHAWDIVSWECGDGHAYGRVVAYITEKDCFTVRHMTVDTPTGTIIQDANSNHGTDYTIHRSEIWAKVHECPECGRIDGEHTEWCLTSSK